MTSRRRHNGRTLLSVFIAAAIFVAALLRPHRSWVEVVVLGTIAALISAGPFLRRLLYPVPNVVQGVPNADGVQVRRQTGVFGLWIPLVISVDGEQVAALKRDETKNLQVPLGIHTVRASARRATSNTLELVVNEERPSQMITVLYTGPQPAGPQRNQLLLLQQEALDA